MRYSSAGFAIVVGLIPLLVGVESSAQRKKRQPAGSERPSQASVAEPGKRVIKAVNDFGLRLFRELGTEKGAPSNLVISPVSIATALAMAQQGASGKTAEVIQKTLELSNLSDDQIRQGFQAMLQNVQKPRGEVEIGVANSIWIQDLYPVHPAYTDVGVNYFHAAIKNAVLSAAPTRDLINRWVAEGTRQKITKMIGDGEALTKETVLLLVNAIHLQGAWNYPFDKSKTRVADFWVDEKTKKQVKMMHLSCKQFMLPHLKTRDMEAVVLHYLDSPVGMTILLPAKGKNPRDLLQLLTPDRWAKWAEQIQPEVGQVDLPRFEFASDLALKDVLSRMGMKIAFDPGADFSRMSPRGKELRIDKVLHKAMLAVDEEGTRAAAASVEDILKGDLPKKEPFQFVVDRPFLVIIHDRFFQEILFLGKVENPGGS